MPASSDPFPTPVAEDERVPATRLDLAGQALLKDAELAWRVEVRTSSWLGLRSRHGRVAVLDDAPEEPSRVLVDLERIRRRVYPARCVVVLGDPSLRERLRAEAASLAAAGIWLHCADGSGSWQNREPRWLERRLTRALTAAASEALSRRSWGRSEADALARRVELDRMLTREDAREVERLRVLLGGRKPRATAVLAALILVVFGLEALWGGVDLPPLLTRMGSLVPARALGGEWWRFFACTLLHGGVPHVVLNVLVLWMLGRSLEPFLGTTRFLLVYFASGLAGSLASSLFVESQSVGASGAIWGLLGAHAAIAFYPRPLLPPAVVGLARRSAGINLALNLVNAFNPHVDVAAHVGGGLMGALLLVAVAASGGLAPQGRASPPAGTSLRVGVATLATAFLAGSIQAIATGRPWQLDRAPELARIDVPGAPFSVAIPRGQTTRPANGSGESNEFGNLAHDPSVIDISWARLADGPSGREPGDELSMIARQLATVPAGLEQLVAPRVVRDDAGPGRSHVSVRYGYTSNPEVVNDRAIGIIDGMLVRIDVIAWAALPRAFDGLAPRILRSFEPSPRKTASLGEPSGVFHSGVSSPPRAGEGVMQSAEQCLRNRCSAPLLDAKTMDVTLGPGADAGSSRAATSLAHCVETSIESHGPEDGGSTRGRRRVRWAVERSGCERTAPRVRTRATIERRSES